MPEAFSVVITTLGLAEIAAALAAGTTISLDNFSVGDGGGVYVEPDVGQTTLVNQQYIAALSLVEVNANYTNQILCSGTIPRTSGGWWVREVGIWSTSGALFAVGKFPETYKSLASSGSSSLLYLEVIIGVVNSATPTFTIDPNIAVASEDYADQASRQYVKRKFDDVVVCSTVGNPAGDSGVLTNPYGIVLDNLRPNTNTERIFPYVVKQKADGRLLTNDIRVFVQGDVDNLGYTDRLTSIGENVGLNAPEKVRNKDMLYLDSSTVLYCTFNGTGLNLIWSPALLVTTDIEYSLDGGAWTTVSYSNVAMTSLSKSDTLGVVDKIVSGQTYGEHTVRVRIKSSSNYSNTRILGFDILSDYDTIRVPTGTYFINGALLTNVLGADLTPSAISTNNHRRDLIVIGEDLVIHFINGAVVDTPTYYLDSGFNTERAKEEIKNTYLTSEFYQGNSFAKTLGDGVTNFQSDQLVTIDSNVGINIDSHDVPWVNPYAKGYSTDQKFTFVGTGCDVQLRLEDIGGSVTDVIVNIYVDEVLKGTLTEANFENVEAAGGDSYINYPICTGLPYGTHTVRLEARQEGKDNLWRNIAYGAGLFVAVATSSNTTSIMTSPDAITWTIRTTPTNYWSDIGYGNGYFVCVADSGTGDRIMTSPDGINWTSRTSPADNGWQNVTYANSIWVAVASTGTYRIMTATDPTGTWTLNTSATHVDVWSGLAYGAGIWVTMARSGSTNTMTATDPTSTWTKRTNQAGDRYHNVRFANGIFLAVANKDVPVSSTSRFSTSTDGLVWAQDNQSPDDQGYNDCEYGNNKWVASNYNGLTSRMSYSDTSDPTGSWSKATTTGDLFLPWSGIIYANSLFVSVAAAGTRKRVMTSPDGVTWTIRTTVIGADGNWGFYLKGFSVYQAKTPDMLASHLKLGCVGSTPTDGWINYSPSQAKYLGSQWNKVRSIDGSEPTVLMRSFGYDISCLTGDTTGDTAEFVFNGTSVLWLGSSGTTKGKVKVYLDGTVLTTSHPDWATITVTTAMPSSWINTTGIVDCYEAGGVLVAEREGIKITGLSEGQHTIKLEGSGKNASSTDYDIPVHGFKIIPLDNTLDIEQNWEGNLSGLPRNCSTITSDPKIEELERDKQDQSNVLDNMISESIIESGNWEDSLADASTPFTVAPTRVCTIPFKTTKVKTPILILVNTGGNDGVAANITKTNFRIGNGADTSIEYPDMIVQWTAIAQ